MRIAWDKFVDLHPSGGFWATRDWLDYLAAWPGAADLSFGIQEGRQLTGLCPLVLDGAGTSGPPAWPLAASTEAEGLAFEEAARRARTFGRSSLTFRQASPLAPPAGIPEGWRDVSWRTRVIDLTLSPAALHAGARKSYRHLINRGLKEWEVVVDIAGAHSGAYQAVHAASVGQLMPRPQRTYELQAEWIRQGLAFQVGARQRRGGPVKPGDHSHAGGTTGGSSPPPSTIPSVDGWVAWCYVFSYRGGAYYGSGPSLVPSAMHALVWTAILEAQQRGLQWFDMGWQGEAQDDKERGIERFKGGFGGRDVQLTAAEIVL